jgi:hypothetical protein
MTLEFECPQGGHRLRVKAEFAGKKVRCPKCGAVITAPAARASAQPGSDLPIPLLESNSPARPDAVAAKPLPVLPIDAEPRGRRPPPPSADAENCCAGCGRFLAPDAVICIDCGFNRQTGKQLRTVSRRRQHTWYLGGFSSPASIIVVAVLYLILILMGFLSESLLAGLLLLFVGVIPALLLLGTFTRIRITRDPLGRPVVIRDRWAAFLRYSHAEIDLEDYQLIRLGHHQGAVNLLVVGIMLLFCFFGMIPGIIFWILLFRGSSFTLEIAGEHEGGIAPIVEPRILYRGPSEAKMRDIGDTLKEVAGLHYG